MSTRLYPMCKNPAVLEKLANVPKGTYWKLQAFNIFDADRWPLPLWVRNLFAAQLETLAMWHFRVKGNTALGQLDDFLLNGWGRARSEICFTGSRSAIGSTTDLSETAAILADQGVSIPPSLSLLDLEGLAWG